MALAKYLEDLTEDYLEGLDWRLNPVGTRDPSREWSLAKEQKSVAVRLLHPSKVVWDDREAFYTIEPISAMIDTTRSELPVTISWRCSRGPYPKIEPIRGGVCITALHVISGDMILECGNYRKAYRVSFTNRAMLETLPDFSAQLGALVQDPLSWNQATFDTFRDGAESLLQTHQLPEDFCLGVREFYLGLYHEQLREPRFGERLDRAALLLRPFLGHSRLALIICSYQMYRINAFDHQLVALALKRIGRAARFFSGGAFSPAEIPSAKPASPGATKILISAADHAMMEGIEAMDRSDTVAFWKRAETVREHISPHDYQGQERFNYLRSRVCKECGENRRAKEFCVNLAQSPIPSFRNLAQQIR
jgi:hypothetical protein